MSKTDQLGKTKQLLYQALNTASQSYPNDKDILEAKVHIKQALQKLETAGSRNNKLKEQSSSNFSKWWGDIVAHSPLAKMSDTAAARAIKNLDSLIAEQNKIINDLDKISNNTKSATANDENSSLLKD